MDSLLKVVTRFAPSPSGGLHIGGARTALYNFLYAKRQGGKFLVRLEDTNKDASFAGSGSVEVNIASILDDLRWLGITSDGAASLQSESIARHVAIAHRLVEKGQAYYCYASVARVDKASVVMASKARSTKASANGKAGAGACGVFRSPWRDFAGDSSSGKRSALVDAPPEGVCPVVRLKVPLAGSITISDAVKGEVTLPHEQIDDFVLLRSDGTPTYMLSVVADDYASGITHIIRGDDHFTNSFRQRALYRACCAAGIFSSTRAEPNCAHIPLVLDEDGGKLSKRKGSRSIGSFRDAGVLPEALVNFILRLGWGKGDLEIFSLADAQNLFDLDGLSRATARISYARLDNLNGFYLRELDLADLQSRLTPFLPSDASELARARFLKGVEGLRKRATSLQDIVSLGDFYFAAPSLPLRDSKALAALQPSSAGESGDIYVNLQRLRASFASIPSSDWHGDKITSAIRAVASAEGLGFGAVARPVRALCAGRMDSPDLGEILGILGRDETISRIANLPRS